MDYTRFSVGLTGGIGSGKTFVSNILAELGASIVDADVISRELTVPGGAGIEPIRQAFGESFIDGNGALDRTKMRERVFGNPAERLRLEGILHPLIRDICFQQALEADGSYVVFVNPLLIELPVWKGMGTRILVVDCPKDLQVQRVMLRSGLSAEQAKAIIAAQATRQQRLARADDVIVNDRNAEEIRREVEHLHRTYLVMARDAN
ncbi:MAG: dephospho-CoA kinase [Oxalobacter sp.]